MDNDIKPETVEDILRSMEGTTVTYGDEKSLIYRLGNAMTREMDALYEEIEAMRDQLGM